MNRINPRLSTGCQQKDGAVACDPALGRGDNGKSKEIPACAGMTRVGAGMTKKDLLLYKLILLIPGMHGRGCRAHFEQKKFRAGYADPFF